MRSGPEMLRGSRSNWSGSSLGALVGTYTTLRSQVSTHLGGAFGPRVSIGKVSERFRGMRPLRRGLTIAILLGLLAIPVLTALAAFADYQQLSTLGQDAVHHLLAAKDALVPSQSSASTSCGAASAKTSSPTATSATATSAASNKSPNIGVPDAAHLATAQHEFLLAQHEFRQLGDLLDRPGPTLTIAGDFPGVANKITAVRQLVYVGDDIATIGYNLLTAATPLLTRLHNGALAADTQPLITRPEATALRGALAQSLGLFNDVEARVSAVNPDDLPVSACQRKEYEHLASLLPDVRGLLAKAPEYFDVAAWVLGVDQPRQFFIQTMDPDELRPTGGFTGDFAVIQTGGGRVKPFQIMSIDCCYLNTPYNLRPPTVYEWWPFPRWGLRDSNLSPDFPTTARMNINLFEGPQHMWRTLGLSNHKLDGVVQVSAIAIAHVLLVTGPLTVPAFGDKLTVDNFWNVILAYQNNGGRIAREQSMPICHNVPLEARKCFTYYVGKLLEDKVRHMSFDQLLTLSKTMVKDVQSHDIQIYVTDPGVEDFLVRQGLAQHLNTTPGVDSLMIDQANTSVNKISRSVNVTLHDNVVLDNKGGATHHVVITFANDPRINPDLYAYSYIKTYRDYVRVYVPSQAQLQYANGFDTGRPVCWVAPPWNPTEKQPPQFSALPPCDQIHGFFQDRSLVCPSGGYGPGPRSTDAFGGDGKTDMPVDDTGYPTNYASDVAGRAMFGGYVTIPINCTATVTLTYYVPNVALPSSKVAASAPAYTYIIERQAGTYINMDITIKPASAVAAEATQPVRSKGTLGADITLTVARLKPQQAG
jgi:hypothetical protein